MDTPEFLWKMHFFDKTIKFFNSNFKADFGDSWEYHKSVANYFKKIMTPPSLNFAYLTWSSSLSSSDPCKLGAGVVCRDILGDGGSEIGLEYILDNGFGFTSSSWISG